MANLCLIKPTIALEQEYLAMLADWKANDERHLPWFINIVASDFAAMVKRLDELSKGIGVEDNFVENSTYWLINEDKRIIGAINIRHRLNEFLLNYGGQIGYGVRPSERGKGCAKEMLRLGLEICRNMGFARVLLCCNKNNPGSVRTIIANGGVLDSEGIYQGEEIQRYWIACAKH